VGNWGLVRTTLPTLDDVEERQQSVNWRKLWTIAVKSCVPLIVDAFFYMDIFFIWTVQ